MKLLNTCLLHYAIVVGALLGAPLEGADTAGTDQSGDSIWPRERYQDGNRLMIH